MSSSRTVNEKVARRVRGYEGRAKAAEENAARLYEQVKAMRAEIDAMTERTGAEFKALRELVESVSATVAQFDQSAQGRMDSLCEDICGLSGRICLLEQAAKPVIEKPALALETVRDCIARITSNQE